MAISVGIHGLVFLVLFFLVAWRAPNPPNPEYGIELNFGLDQAGTGDVQPTTPVGSDNTDQIAELEENTEDESSPQTNNETEQEQTEVAPVEQEVISKVESPEVIEEKEEVKDVPKNVEKPVEKKEEPKVVEEPKAVYQPNTKSTADGDAKKTEGQPASQGDSKSATGDQGNPEGALDAKALYGKQGGGDGGPSLDLAGWEWDHIPEPKTPDNELSGRIVFTIEVDENGDLIRYRKESGTVSAAAERACIEAIQRLTFTKKAGARVPPVSKGKITFVIRSE